MEFSTKVSSIFECSLERAFKTPILCDVSKVHTGYLFSPKVTHTTEDEGWGKVNSSKKIHAQKTLFQKGGFLFVDRVIEREENKYWKIQVDDFQTWALGFYKFVGKWETTLVGENRVQVDYSYTLHTKNPLYAPFNWLFTKLFWRAYMKRVVENIRVMAYNKEPYQYD